MANKMRHDLDAYSNLHQLSFGEKWFNASSK